MLLLGFNPCHTEPAKSKLMDHQLSWWCCCLV